MFKGLKFSHKFLVFQSLPCKGSGIIGDDFLRKYTSVIDYNSNTLTLTSMTNERVHLPVIRKMKTESYCIPYRSESIHYIDTDLNEDCVVCSKEISEGVYIASSIVKPLNGKIPIRVLNVKETDVIIPEIKPSIHSLKDYDLCSFKSTISKDSERVKKLFSALQLQHLSKEERTSIESLCAKFCDEFYVQGDKLNTTNIYEHSILLKPDTQPVYSKPFRLPHSQKNEIQKQIDKMLQEGIIEPQ